MEEVFNKLNTKDLFKLKLVCKKFNDIIKINDPDMNRKKRLVMLRKNNELLKLIKQNPDEDWNWYLISKNPNITIEVVESNPDYPWNWSALSLNPNITPNIIKLYKKNWDWEYVSRNPNININFVLENLDKKWDWYYLRHNKAIKESDVKNNPNLPWISSEGEYTIVKTGENTFNMYRNYKVKNVEKNYSYWWMMSKNKFGIIL
jgi:hypothetical protein